LTAYVYRVFEKNYYGRYELLHAATECRGIYVSYVLVNKATGNFAPPGEFRHAGRTPLWKGGRVNVCLGVFDRNLGDYFTRFESKFTKKGKYVRGKTISFKFLGTEESTPEPMPEPME